VPESRFLSRDNQKADFPAHGGGGGSAGGMFRLRVLCSLPQTHQSYFFDEVQKLCRDYLRNRRGSPSEITPEELVSEVWEKFLGTTSLPGDDEEPLSNPSEWSVDPYAPERDGRVVWLSREMQEICGAQALEHRCEDIRRKRWGRAVPQGGRRMVQPDEENDFLKHGVEPEQESAFREADARQAWRGLLLTVRHELSAEDDVVKLLQLLERQPDILEGASSTRWPVKMLIKLLDSSFAPPAWSEDRFDNAKRRLTNWVNRLKQKNGLDAVDLEGLFARVARQQERGKRLVRKGPRPAKLHS
jgi:hypothetical protein